MTEEHVVAVRGTTVMVCSPEGLPLDSDRAATELIGEALQQRAGIVVIPSERLTDDFYELDTGLADDLTQKFGTYRLHLVVVGDVEERAADSSTLTAWIDESNRGSEVWFTPTFEDFTERLVP